MKILWHTKLGEAHSWCYVVHDLINAMLEIGGHEIHCKSTDNLDHLPNNLKSHLIKGYHGNLLNGPADFLSDNGLIKVHPNAPLKEIPDINAPYDLELAYTIFYQFCRRFKQESRCRAAIWNFESSILPPGWDQYHRAIDYILPSSQFSYDIFAQNGVPKDKMLVVPHGINTEIFNPSIPPFKLKTQKRVKFLHVARAHARKLHDRVINGYLDAFTGDDDVCLVLKTEFKKPDKDKIFEVDIKEILENAHKGRKNPAEIEVILDHVPFIGSLYTACDSVVSMSSTEGFCCPLLESLACGKPIIVPRYGGQLEFLNDSNALLVNTKEMYAPASHQYWVASNKAVVGDPDIEHYKQLLRYLYENLEYETNRIKEAAKTTVEKFSWKNAAQMILDLPIPKISKRFHNKRKVAYIIPYAMVGGGEIWVKNVIKTLDENYESHAILVNGSNDLFKESLRKLNVIVEDLSYLPEQERGPALKCLIEAENYSIVHFYNSFGIYNVIKNAWQQGFRARVVETVHSDLKWPDSMSKISKRDNFVSAIATISKKQAEILAKANNKNIMFLPQQVEWERFKLPRNKDVLHKLNIKTDFVVGFVGRISPEKNTPLILQCAKQLPDVSFVIIGDGPQENALKQLGKSIKNIHFLGFRNDVELFYPTFDVLLITSTIEGIALVSLEAMTAGTPVISTNVGAMGEVVNNTNGFLLSSNAQLFINAIATLKTNKDLHKTLINGSYETSKKYEQLGAEININKLYNSLF